MISRFFIDRPIFASVISIVITLAGGISLFNLPLAMYPAIAPPTVQVDCKYPGASAQVVAETVAAPLEQKVNGVEGMLYMSSQCTNDGSYNLTVTFQHGVNLNMAQVLVQNRVALAMPLLPDVIKQAGVTARKRSPDILLAVALNSKDGRYDQLFLSNYAALHVKDEIARLPGISDVNMMGTQDYSMRVWVDPEKLASRNMTALDVVAAIREQNKPVAAGQIGQPPVPDGQAIQMTLDAKGRLTDVEGFENIIVKTVKGGHVVRLKDVARVAIGARSLDVATRVNGKPSASLAIFLLPDANALETADLVKAKMADLAKNFPEGMQFEIRYDTTPFIRESIAEVFKTLREATILVAIVVLLFLQNWRSAVIPLVAVPVAIVGTFAVLAVMGFSINNLTLFGLVLAIGIVVDDAIVVVEAVEHHMELGLAPRAATIVAMQEVSGPVIAIGLVLSAVFVPCAFITGIVGQFFRQFALTIAASTIISTINSLTLSPALAALLLKPKAHGPGKTAKPKILPPVVLALIVGWMAVGAWYPRVEPRLLALGWLKGPLLEWGPTIAAIVGGVLGFALTRPINFLLAQFFRLFNFGFRTGTNVYTWSVGVLLKGSVVVLLIYGGLIYQTYRGFITTPTGFIPSQDMGYLLANVQLPDAAAFERTQDVMTRMEAITRKQPGVKFTQCVSGQSLLLSAFGSNFGSMFIILDKFENRRTPELYGEAIAAQLRAKFTAKVPDATITVLGPPPVRGVGRAGGFKLLVQDRADLGLRTLQAQTEKLTEAATKQKQPVKKPEFARMPYFFRFLFGDGGGGGGPPVQEPEFVGMTSVFRATVPQLFADVDRREVTSKLVSPRELFSTMQVYLGSLYVNDFNMYGRTWQVIVQADSKFRNAVENVKQLKVRNAKNKMVPIGSLADIREVNGPLVLTRYNMYTAAPINGSAAPGVSSGDGIKTMERLAREELIGAMSIEWTELAFLELQAGSTAMTVFGFAVVMVFLVLAAQYESWSMPLAVILVVPMCLLCSIAGVKYANQDINIFTQVGFVVLVGLACKNAILIVEFARSKRLVGVSRREATLQACRLRLRPIVMTSLAFILGVVPLLVTRGAGAEMRRTLGITVFSGMLGVTAFGLVLTPVFFSVIDWLGETKLFRSRALQRVGSVIFGIFALGYLRHYANRRFKPSMNGVAVGSHNGNGNGHGNGNGNGNGHHPASPDEAAELVEHR